MNESVSYTLSMKSDSGSEITLNTQMPEEIVRLLQLSGQGAVTSHAPMSTSSPCGCANYPACGHAPIQDEVIMEQQAEHDYGHKDPNPEHEFDIKDYNWKGRADLPERLTSARFGSNPLKSEMREHASYESLKAAYEQFLTESENEAGLMSPFTADERDEFDHDPLSDEDVVDDGSRSPLSRIERQDLPK